MHQADSSISWILRSVNNESCERDGSVFGSLFGCRELCRKSKICAVGKPNFLSSRVTGVLGIIRRLVVIDADQCSTGDDVDAMKLTYPPVSETLSDAALAFKIARHTPCTACDTCLGLRPPPSIQVVLSNDDSRKSSLGVLDQYGSDEDDEPAYLCTCVCGHEVADHGADEGVIGRDEFSRRARLAVRLDETLQASPYTHIVLHD